jgi:hypothetical protein
MTRCRALPTRAKLGATKFHPFGNEESGKKLMVGLARFELATNGLGNRCSIHLSYSPSSTDYTIFTTMRLSTVYLVFQ